MTTSPVAAGASVTADRPGAASTTDGRVRRGERTRNAIVDALLALLHDGVLVPTAAQIADGAGVSVRSVFQHFDDLDALHLELAAEQARRVQPLLDPPESTGSLDDRIADLVERRAELFEFITPVRHAIGSRAHTSTVLRSRIDELSADLRTQVEACFDHELTSLEPDERRRTLDALDVIAGFETWDQLRVFRSLPRAEAADTVVVMLRRMLG
ncbi:MAG: TetR/AcrR family transcriptional regulator [Actinomycetota bacterium]|nr:TetR/AcrR family transcriptional regulator [Actinomycetota bacterium]